MSEQEMQSIAALNYNDVNLTWLYRFFHRNHVAKFNKVFLPILKVVFIAFVFLVLYLPVILIAVQSVNNSADPASFGGLTLQWYTEIFKYRSLRSAILDTLLVAFLTLIISTVLGTLFAIGIHALEKKKRQKFIILNNIPLVNAEIVTGISLMLLFSLLLPIFPSIFGLPTMLIAHVFFTLPYVVLSVLPKLSELDANMYDAAVDLGDSPIKALSKVIVPAIWPGIIAGAMLAFTMSIDDFVISYYTTGNGFNNISIWIYSSIGKTSLKPAIYAYSTIVTLLASAFIVVAILWNNHKRKAGTKIEK